jgi:fatty acid desaturase
MHGSIWIQQRLRKEITRRLGSETLKALRRPRALRTLGTLAHIWLAIALGFWIGGLALGWPLALGAPVGLLLALWMATRINALNVLVHEGSHQSLAASRRCNRLLTNAFAGYWIGYDEDSYREIHQRHHRYLNERDDPDLPLYSIAASRAQLARGFLEDLLAISAARRALVYARGDGGESAGRLFHAGAKALANLLLLGWLVVQHGPLSGALSYGLFWILPLLCLYPAIIRLRTIAEHFAPELSVRGSQPVFVARSTRCGPLGHYLLGAQMDYHFEHHLFPSIAYAELALLHTELVRCGFFAEGSPAVLEHSLTGGYLRFWRSLLRRTARGRDGAKVAAAG